MLEESAASEGEGEGEGLSDHHKSFLYKAVIIVGGGGLIFGYDIGVISGTLPFIKDDFNLDGYEEGLVVSILYAGSIIGSIFGGPMCDAIGRWKTIQIQNVIFIIGALSTGLAPNLSVLCIGRFFVGVASAISGLADVPYLTEIARPEYRGILSGQYEILVGAGILLSFCLDLLFASFNNGWRYAFLLPGFLAFLQSIGLFFLPESPRWLISKGKHDEAVRASQIIYGDNFPSDLLYDSNNSNNNSNRITLDQPLDPSSSHPMTASSYSSAENPLHSSSYSSHHDGIDLNNSNLEVVNHNNKNNNRQVNTNDSSSTNNNELLITYRYAIIVIILLQILSQITGCNIIRNYAPTIFEEGGVSTNLALFYNILLGIVKLIFTIISVVYIENTGRKNFYLFGISIILFGMIFLSIASFFTTSGNISNPEIFVIGCGFIYAGFGFSYGPIPWILSSEMVPSSIRGRVICISLIAANLTQLIMNFLFFPMTEYLKMSGTFLVFLLLNIISLYYGYHFLVETKEIPPEMILKGLILQYEQFWKLPIRDMICLKKIGCRMVMFGGGDGDNSHTDEGDVMDRKDIGNIHHHHQLSYQQLDTDS